MSRSAPATFDVDAIPVTRVARLLVAASGVAFGMTLVAALLAPLSWSMWAALSGFLGIMGAQACLYLHVSLAPVRDRIGSR